MMGSPWNNKESACEARDAVGEFRGEA